jgi:hypothetical protein
MLTPYLEKLILCGKASYNTLSIGGSQKTIFNVAKDRFIIITDLTIFNHLDINRTFELTDIQFNDYMSRNMLTQLSIFSDRSYNNFIVRNEFDFETRNNLWHVLPKGHTKFDTYLIHNTDISFTWIKSADMKAFPGDTEAISTARPFPFDYGKIGQVNQQVVLKNDVAGTLGWSINQAGNTYPLPNLVTTNQLQFPVNPVTTLQNFELSYQYPVANIGFVEVFEEINNISATL